MCIAPRTLYPVLDANQEIKWFMAARDRATFSAVLDEGTGEMVFPFQVGCGHCLECIQVHKMQWVHRLQDELKLHKDACFITLTYNEDNCPRDGVSRRDLQLFLKRLRATIDPVKIRYFACGEYGSHGKRPHYHAVIFGYRFNDVYRFQKDRKGFWIYRSPELEKLWPLGFSSVQDVHDKNLEYVTKDMQKLLTLEEGRHEPFTAMSLKPGIGVGAWDRRLTDGKIYHAGKSCPIPRYYKKVAEREGIDLTPLNVLQAKYSENRAAILDEETHWKEYQEKKVKLLDKNKMRC